MNKEEALAIIQKLQNEALKLGLFADVKIVNQVSMAIATLQADILENKEA